MTQRKRLLLADDHALIRSGIRRQLDTAYDVVGEVGDGRALVAVALTIRPDLIILDVSMPLLNGIHAARQIIKEWPEARLLFLSMHASTMYLREAMDAGGLGYVLKSSAAEELDIAVRRVLNGQVYVTPGIDHEAWPAAQGSLRRRCLPAGLTQRQGEVLQLIAEGHGNKEVASRLDVSVKTVEFHRGRIMRKLGAHSVADLVRYAVQAGIVGI